MRSRSLRLALLLLLTKALSGCPDDEDPKVGTCTPGAVLSCQCLDGRFGTAVCPAMGELVCVCDAQATAGTAVTSAGVMATAGTTGMAGVAAQAGVEGAGIAGVSGVAAGSGAAGLGDMDAGLDAAASAGPFDALRQVCVDEINTYRATLGLPPLQRADADDEACSDDGAKLDHETDKPHGSSAANAIPCRTKAVAQNSCPDWAYGGRAGTQEEQLKQCLKQMWAEGEPPQGVEQCVAEYFDDMPACFLAHGHYINMISTDSTTVSCGFHDSGGVLYMNQDFD